VDTKEIIHELADVEDPSCLGEGTKVWRWTHIMKGVNIGSNCKFGQGCFVQEGVVIGDNVNVQNGVYLYKGLIIEDNVFIGPNVAFTNVKRPNPNRPTNNYITTILKKGCAIGANATIICGTIIHSDSIVGAGAVVTKDVLEGTQVVGNPARILEPRKQQ